MACILPAAYMSNIPRGTSFCMSEQILWTDVRDDTRDTDEEDDTYDDLRYL